jgi:hypothetical protein
MVVHLLSGLTSGVEMGRNRAHARENPSPEGDGPYGWQFDVAVGVVCLMFIWVRYTGAPVTAWSFAADIRFGDRDGIFL